MNGRQICFFATKEDLQPVIKDIEAKFPIQYTEAGMFDEKAPRTYFSIDDIECFGYPAVGDWVRDKQWIVTPRGADIVIREVPQKKGGIKYAVDPGKNPVSIIFQFGGIAREGLLVAGKCGSVFLSDFMLEVFHTFSGPIKKRFRKAGNFYVGKESEEKLKQGWRLVTLENSPQEYDLKFE